MIWRISSMPRLEAPSISSTSLELPCAVSSRGSPARRARRTPLTVHHLGEDARRDRLTNTAHAGEKKGVRNTLGANRVLQRAGDRLLTGYVLESLRTPFSRDHQIFG